MNSVLYVIINEYLAASEFATLSPSDWAELCGNLENKVSSIKFLRDTARVPKGKPFKVPKGAAMSAVSRFITDRLDQGFKTVGLKEAKELVEWMINNPELI